MNRNIDKEIEQFIHSIKDLWKGEPLDGDETEDITNKILIELDYINANE